MIEEHLQNNPTQLAPLTSVVNQMLEDAQERLVYRAHIYVQTDITSFRPAPGDLAYPSKLQMMESIAESLASQRKMHSRNPSVSSISSVRFVRKRDSWRERGRQSKRNGEKKRDLQRVEEKERR